MNLIVVFSESDDCYDTYFCPPENMTISEATTFVGAAVKELKEAAPTTYRYDDLLTALTVVGFTQPRVMACEEKW